MHAHIEGQAAVVGGEQRFQRLDVHVHLALVVDSAAGVKVAVALGRFKGRRDPLIERIGRLHVIVAIGEAGGLALGVQPVGVDQRMSGGLR